MADGQNPSTILIVDDEVAVVQCLTALLELESDHRVLGETSPVRAIQSAKVNSPDLVISDFLMPEMDGIKFLLEIRGLYPESTLILLTGYADKENAIRAINSVGLYQYIEKPWDNDSLLIVIKNGLEKRALLRALEKKIAELDEAHSSLKSIQTELIKAFM